VRLALALLALALGASGPALAAPLREGTPQLQIRFEGLVGQPTTLLGPRGGGALGIAYRLTDQLWAIGDLGTRAAPGGGAQSIAAGLQATFDMTPIEPYLEVCVVQFTNHEAMGYSLATRIGLGADWRFTRGWRMGLVVRNYSAFDPDGNDEALAGFEVALRFSFTPGER
jgi:hypothetical protein